jgi:hypothetical protein
VYLIAYTARVLDALPPRNGAGSVGVEKRTFLDTGGVGGAQNAFGVAAGEGSVLVVVEGVGVAECSTGAAEAGGRRRSSGRQGVADPDVLCPRAGSKEKTRALSVRTGECDLAVTERRCSVPARRTVVGKAARRFTRDVIGSADLQRT